MKQVKSAAQRVSEIGWLLQEASKNKSFRKSTSLKVNLDNFIKRLIKYLRDCNSIVELKHDSKDTLLYLCRCAPGINPTGVESHMIK